MEKSGTSYIQKPKLKRDWRLWATGEGVESESELELRERHGLSLSLSSVEQPWSNNLLIFLSIYAQYTMRVLISTPIFPFCSLLFILYFFRDNNCVCISNPLYCDNLCETYVPNVNYNKTDVFFHPI